MRNKLYQWLWYKIVRPLVKCDDTKTGFSRSAKRYKAAYRLSLVFGGPDAVFMTDSNGSFDDNYETMKLYKSLVLLIQAGGQTPGDATAFLNSPSGAWLAKVIHELSDPAGGQFCLGGNCVLKNQMDTAKLQLTQLHDIFPASYNQTTPPVRAWFLDMLDNSLDNNKSEAQWQEAFNVLNDYIIEIWGSPFTIDMHRILKDPKTSDAYLLALRDAVHYSKYSVLLRQAILNQYL